jgi:hypothetical protein
MKTYTITTVDDGRVLHDVQELVAVVEKRRNSYVVNVYYFGRFKHTAWVTNKDADAVFIACALGKVIALGAEDYRPCAFLKFVSLSCGEPVSKETEKAMYGILNY